MTYIRQQISIKLFNLYARFMNLHFVNSVFSYGKVRDNWLGYSQVVFRTEKFRKSGNLVFVLVLVMSWNRSQMFHYVKKLDYLCNCKSEISNDCNTVEGYCLLAMIIVHHHANGCFDWLISEKQSINPSKEAISILSGKYKSFMFVHLASQAIS